MKITFIKPFKEYQAWYQQEYITKVLIGNQCDDHAEVVKRGWHDPFVDLKPLNADQIKKMEAKYGLLPTSYKALLSQVGTGTILCANESEPLTFNIFPPSKFTQALKIAWSWLDKENREVILKKEKINIEKMLPVFSDSDWGFFGMLAHQKPNDDRIFLFDHAFEPGFPFSECQPLPKFFEIFLSLARKLKPLNPYDGLRSGQ